MKAVVRKTAKVQHRPAPRSNERRLVLSMTAGVAEHELIAVGRRLRDALSPDHAARAADVLDDHLLAQDFGDVGIKDSANDIARAAGGGLNH